MEGELPSIIPHPSDTSRLGLAKSGSFMRRGRVQLLRHGTLPRVVLMAVCDGGCPRPVARDGGAFYQGQSVLVLVCRIHAIKTMVSPC